MPTYEYICTACEHQWEAEQSMKEDALTKCPECKKRTAKRQISGGTGFLLKGGGWYSDLYGSSPPPAADSADADKDKDTTKSKSTAKTDKGSETASADKKPDAKPSSGDASVKTSTSSKGSAKGS